MTDLQKQIEELERISNGNRSDGTTWHDGRISMAKSALLIIKQLEDEIKQLRALKEENDSAEI